MENEELQILNQKKSKRKRKLFSTYEEDNNFIEEESKENKAKKGKDKKKEENSELNLKKWTDYEVKLQSINIKNITFIIYIYF